MPALSMVVVRPRWACTKKPKGPTRDHYQPLPEGMSRPSKRMPTSSSERIDPERETWHELPSKQVVPSVEDTLYSNAQSRRSCGKLCF